MHIDEAQLKGFILDSNLVSKKEILEAEKRAEKNNTSIGLELVSINALTEDDLRRMYSYILGIPFVDLKNQRMDYSVLSFVPEPVARNQNIVAFKKGKDVLEVAMLDIHDLSAIDFVKKRLGLKVLPRLTDTESMKWALLSYQKSLKNEFGDIIQRESASLKSLDNRNTETIGEDDLRKLAENVSVVRIVDTLLKHAFVQHASDIHIEPEEIQTIVRYRIDGALRDAMILPKSVMSGVTARLKFLAGLRIDEKRIPQDGRFQHIEDDKVSLYVSTLPTYHGEKIVLRIAHEPFSGFSLESLGFHGLGLEQIHKSIKHKKGIILAVGPVDSGRTTTLYTLLHMMNTPSVNISTIEDPIKYKLQRVSQTQVRREIGFTFVNGMRALIKQDSDIILVGEIQDSETGSLIVNTALAGSMILSSVCSNSASRTVAQLLDMKIRPFLLASTLDVVIAQRLARRLGDDKEIHFLTKEESTALSHIVSLERMLKFLKEEKVIDKKINSWQEIPFYRSKAGSNTKTAYSGHVGIYEVLKVTETISNLIVKGATATSIEEQAKHDGMMTLLEDGIFKAAQGKISIEEVLRVISE